MKKKNLERFLSAYFSTYSISQRGFIPLHKTVHYPEKVKGGDEKISGRSRFLGVKWPFSIGCGGR